jgi:hypothetical protein
MPVINGTSLEVQNRVIQADGLMVQMQEHFDPFILNWQLKHPSMFRDRIPMAKYPAFSGVSQESYIFRGSNSADQAGLADWRDVTPSSKASGANPANDRCSYDPKTFDWAWDKIGYSGKRREWKSPVFCVMDLYTQDQAREQLSMIITAGAEVTDQTREVYNREMYMKLAVNANKFVVLAEGMGLSYIDNPLARVSYDPAAVDTDGDTYIEFDKSLFGRISTLNWSPFNLIRAYMADAAPDAAQGMDSGMPIFTLLIDLLDFEEMIFNDSKVREDMRYAEARQLISGYNMGFKIYRGMGIVHDVRQARYDGGQIGVGLNAGALFGLPVVRCKRIKPRRATRPGVVGMIPETNPDYITAPYGTAVLFLNNVAQVLVPDPISNLGSGLTFGPAPGFNGQWQWINHKNNTDNPLGEVGYFFSRFEYHLRAMRYAEHAMVVLYKRCQQVIATNCAIDSAASAKNTSMLEDAPVAADFDGTALTVELSLANKLTAGVGKKVTIKKDDTNEFEAFIMDAQNAPVYKFGWITGGTNVPAAVGEINDITVVTVTVA